MSSNHFYSLDGPLELMPTARQMRIANLGAFPSLARHFGADPKPLLERYDIDPRVIRDPDHYIDCKSFVDLLEHCSEEFNDPLFGLHLAEMQEPDVYGCVIALCRAAASVREALNCLIEYIPVTHSPAAQQELCEDGDLAELRWGVRTDLGCNKQANYHAALLNVKLLRQLGGSDFSPRYVHLSADFRHRDIERLERYFGCRIYSTPDHNAIGFDKTVLNHALPSANRLLFNLVGGYLKKVKETARISLDERVEDYIRSSLASGNCSIERCASKLGMSVRTLQSRLTEANLSFSDILEEQRAELARSYLKQAQFSLDDVAVNLGYSEQSSFGRAFKRWTGITPKQYRQENLPR